MYIQIHVLKFGQNKGLNIREHSQKQKPKSRKAC